MPKGEVAEREVICRACGEPFLSIRCGKAAFYCGRQECARTRRRARSTVANIARREKAVERRQERARNVRDRLAAARQGLDKAVRDAQKRQRRVQQLAAELALLEGRPRPVLVPPVGSSARPPAEEEPRSPHIPTGDLVELIKRTEHEVLERVREGGVENRLAVRRAVVDVANAEGLVETRAALHRLGVEALAWEYRLRGGGRELGQAAKEAAS